MVDLSAVDHIDSWGLSALIGGLQSTRPRLRRPPDRGGPQVEAVLHPTNIDRVLVSHDTGDAAAHGW